MTSASPSGPNSAAPDQELGVPDTRRPAYGAGRALIAVYGVFALSATGRATWQLMTKAHEAPVAYVLSAVSALVYILATIAMAHNGRRMRTLAWLAVGFELVGVVTVGVLSLTLPELFAHDSVWSQFGSGYGYIPLLLPMLGIWWLWWSSPKRISAGDLRSNGKGA